MKLLLFLGTGISVPSGLPTAAKLMDIILNAPYHHQGDGLFSTGLHPDRELRVSDLTRRIRRLLRLLISHDTRDIKRSGAAFRDTTTYEDIFFLCQQIRDWNIGLSDNSLTTPF
jgi:hypothetical protein